MSAGNQRKSPAYALFLQTFDSQIKVCYGKQIMTKRHCVAIDKSTHHTLLEIKRLHGITLKAIVQQAIDNWIEQFNKKIKEQNESSTGHR
jgi:hypothetical protein